MSIISAPSYRDDLFEFSAFLPSQARGIRQRIAQTMLRKITTRLAKTHISAIYLHKFCYQMSDLAYRTFEATIKKKFHLDIKNTKYKTTFKKIYEDAYRYFYNQFNNDLFKKLQRRETQ